MGGNAVSVKFLAPSGNGLSCSAQNKIACEGFSGVGSTLMGCEAYLSPTPADAKLKAAENLLGKTRASGK